jgi:hypothetical protein
MRSNRLPLNVARTEILWCSSARQHQIPKLPLTVGLDSVTPVSHVRDLSIYVDADLSMRTHISKTVSSCFGVLRQIRSTRRSVSRPTLVALVTSLEMTRLDYGSAALASLPRQLTDRLQAVLNAAALLINDARRSDHVTPLLRSLHWLRATERINFWLAVLAYRCLHGLSPSYLAGELRRVADVSARQRLRSLATADLIVPHTNCSTIGDHAFPVAASRVWNSLPPSVISSPTLCVFRRRLKTELFARSHGSN